MYIYREIPIGTETDVKEAVGGLRKLKKPRLASGFLSPEQAVSRYTVGGSAEKVTVGGSTCLFRRVLYVAMGVL